MNNAYQPIYDAVRSRLSNGDISEAVMQALREANLGHYAEGAAQSVQFAVAQYERPSAVYRPRLVKIRDEWCAFYGEEKDNGPAGYGTSPENAMRAFDEAWYNRLGAK
jgi:hypothetical protein